MLEVTNRISTDEGGGTPIKYGEQVHILELSQIPYDHVSLITIVFLVFYRMKKNLRNFFVL